MRTRLLSTCAALAAVLCLAPGVASAAVSKPHDPSATPARSLSIYGGTPLASSQQAPWSVLVERLTTSGQWVTYCSGNLVSTSLVLTAGHCAVDEDTKQPISPTVFRIQAGGVAENQPDAQYFGVSAIAVHPYYTSAFKGDDVSMFALATPITPSPLITPIAVAAPKTYVKDGKPLSFFGWGATEAQAPQGLRGMTTNAVTSAACAPGLATIQCAFNRNQAPCGGDSGSGLIRTTKAGTPELVGTDSYGAAFPEGQPQCQAGSPEGYADITQPELNAWIGSVIAGAPNPKPPVAPRAKRKPTVKRTSAFSSKLRCTSAGWSPKAKVTTVWAKESNRKVIKSGKSTTLSVGRKLRGVGIFCASYASNSGGKGRVESRNYIRFRK